MRLAEFVLASVALTLLPGPDILFVLAQSLTRGARAGLSVALGLCTGLLVHTLVVALGVAVVIARSPLLFNLVKYAGVAYLVYMGIQSLREARKGNGDEYLRVESGENGKTGAKEPTYASLYRTGIVMNVLNPKVILFFLSFLPQFVPSDTPSATTDIFILCGVFALQALAVFAGVSAVAGWLSHKLAVNRLSNRKLSYVRAAVYFLIALLFLTGL